MGCVINGISDLCHQFNMKNIPNILAAMVSALVFPVYGQSLNAAGSQTAALPVAVEIVAPAVNAMTPQEALRLAQRNSEELIAAEAEVTAAKSKMHEAARALWPRLFVEGSQTKGKLLEDVAFAEKRYGLSLEHTIFASGSLWNGYKQAKKQYQAAQERWKRAEIELFFKTIKAYYDLVKAELTRQMYHDLCEPIKADFDATRLKFERHLIAEQEYLETKTKFNQIDFQTVSAEREADIARYKLVRILELNDDSAIAALKDVDTRLDFQRYNFTLAEVVHEALAQRPELKAARLLVEAGDYGRRAAKGKDSWRIDINAFGGKSTSHYTTEPENYRNDWNAVIKVTKTFGSCSAETSFTKEDTSPRLGQNDRTQTQTESARVGIFDNFAKYSQINGAEADYQRARRDFEEARREVGVEAHEAFYDYKEALLRLGNAAQRVRLLEEKLASDTYQMELNQIPLAQVMDTRIRLADEKALHVQSLVDYKIALCKLDKAVGRWGKYSGFTLNTAGEAVDEKN